MCRCGEKAFEKDKKIYMETGVLPEWITSIDARLEKARESEETDYELLGDINCAKWFLDEPFNGDQLNQENN